VIDFEVFDSELASHFDSGAFGEGGFEFGQAGFGGADEVMDGGRGGAHFGEDLFGGDAAVHDPDAAGGAVAAADELEHGAEGRFIGGVAGEHFVGEGEAFGGDNEGDDDLHAVGAAVSAMAEAAGVGGIVGDVALEVGAGEVVEEDFVGRAKEVGPALAEVAKSRCAGLCECGGGRGRGRVYPV
jgi:hypothetical protein